MPDLGLEVPSAFHRNKSRTVDQTPFPFAEGLCKTWSCQGPELPPGGKLFQGEVFSIVLKIARTRITIKIIVFPIILCGLGQNFFQISLLRPEGWYPV